MKSSNFYSAYNITIENCPCPCCWTKSDCLKESPINCQKRLDQFIYEKGNKYIEAKKSKTIHNQLKKDVEDIEKLIIEISEKGGKDEWSTLVFFISRYAYIKELLEKYWKDGENNG